MEPILRTIDLRFAELHARSNSLLAAIPEELLFRRAREIERMYAVLSVGECLLRSGAVVEQLIGGLTRRLWDDAFEWTLPEELSTKNKVAEYLAEVEAERTRGFLFFASDSDLCKTVQAPAGNRTIIDLLSETLVLAAHFQGRAFAVFEAVCDEKPPRV